MCEHAAEGMGASLACGVRAADAAGPPTATSSRSADMPFIRASTIAAVRDALAGGAALAAPYFRARRGHPVGISARFRDELEALRGDEGAKKLLAAHATNWSRSRSAIPAVIRDIDTPGDLAPPLVV